MAKILDPILPILSILGYWAIILGSFGGPGKHEKCHGRHGAGQQCSCTFLLQRRRETSYVGIYVCVYIYIPMYTRIHIRMYSHIPICMCVHIYIQTRISTYM